MLKKMKNLLCALLCAALLLSAGCAAQTPPVPETDAPAQSGEEYVPEAPPAEEEFVYRDENSEDYRALYSGNPIEAAMDARFTSAMSVEDFEALSSDYCVAWKGEYHALMEQLMTLYPDDAEELKGLRDYTNEAAQTAYDEEYALHLYTDEDGQEQVGVAAVQNANFAMAEVYKTATVLSILNDYREEAPYVFHYTAN